MRRNGNKKSTRRIFNTKKAKNMPPKVVNGYKEMARVEGLHSVHHPNALRCYFVNN